MSELTDLRDQLERLGVPAHAHEGDEPCPEGEVCIRESERFIAHFDAPGRAAEAETDEMTAWCVLGDLPDGAGYDAAWAALAEISY